MSDIELVWLSMIKQRRNKYVSENRIRELHFIDLFLEPIMIYGNKKEKHVREYFKNE